MEYELESLMIEDYKIYQSPDLYRFTSDAVLLSRFAPQGKKYVADLCSGSGIIGLHYYALQREKPEKVMLCEIQKDLAEMSEKTVAKNGLEQKFSVINGDLNDICEREEYDLVLCNPPYKKRGSGYPVKNRMLAVCKSEICVTLGEIISVSAKILKRRGSICMCNAVDRLEETFSLFSAHKISPSRLVFVSAKPSGNPYLFMIEGVKGVKTSLTVLPQITNSAKDFSGE